MYACRAPKMTDDTVRARRGCSPRAQSPPSRHDRNNNSSPKETHTQNIATSRNVLGSKNALNLLSVASFKPDGNISIIQKANENGMATFKDLPMFGIVNENFEPRIGRRHNVHTAMPNRPVRSSIIAAVQNLGSKTLTFVPCDFDCLGSLGFGCIVTRLATMVYC